MASTTPTKSRDPLAGYDLDERFFDEALDPSGEPRPHYRGLVAALAEIDLDELDRAVRHDLHSRGVTFASENGSVRFAVDAFPRVIPAAEWEPLAAGLCQRVRALNAFLADAYGERRIVAAGRDAGAGDRGLPAPRAADARRPGVRWRLRRDGRARRDPRPRRRLRGARGQPPHPVGRRPTWRPRATCSTSGCPRTRSSRSARSAGSTTCSPTPCARPLPKASTSRRSPCSPTGPRTARGGSTR